jgi:segregation and condensation protein A
VVVASAAERRRGPGGSGTGRVTSSRASVSFDSDARPDRAALIQLEGFEGPLALLLSLIEQRQMDVLQVPLGDLAGAYLEALAGLPSAQMPHISAFITVSAQLILIKSRAILPRPPAPAVLADEGADPETELRERLLLYRRYRDAAARLAARLSTGNASFHREAAAAMAAARAGARAPQAPPLDPALLADALAATFRLVPEPAPPPGVVARTITLEERAQIIRSALRRAPQVVLQELLRGVRDRVVVAVTFLAMLELVKGRELVIEQAEPWGPIVCRPLPASERGMIAVPIEAAPIASASIRIETEPA